MQPTVSLDRSVIAVRHDEVVHVMLELTAPTAPVLARPPLDIVVVLDRSGSMSGAPIAAVTAATAQLLRLAGPDDRIGVVTFHSDVDVVLPLARHDADIAGRVVRGITTAGSTNLSGGWLKALELLAAAPRPGAIQRIVLLTDGHANAGVTDTDALATMVRGGHGQGITTSCIGFADGYQEELLASLADAGMGNEYFCAGPDHAQAVFGTEFEGLASVVAQNISIEIAPTAAVAAFNVLNEFPATTNDQGVTTISLGDAYGDEQRRVLIAFNLRPLGDAGSFDVATFTVRWASTLGPVSMHTVTLPLTLTADNDPNGIDVGADPRVTEHVLVLRAAEARREARRLADEGRFEQAASALEAGVVFLTDAAAPLADVDEMRRDADELRHGMWSMEQSKRQFSRSRNVTKGRRTNFDDPQDQNPPN